LPIVHQAKGFDEAIVDQAVKGAVEGSDLEPDLAFGVPFYLRHDAASMRGLAGKR
jgi:hypothetical protein